jgi:dipeptidyl aminopeptidase/acylaminoacyl peptidase
MTPVVVAPTVTPAGAATAQWQARVATAQVALSGTPTPLPPNVWTATPAPTGWLVVVTNTPTPRTWSAAVAQAQAGATRRATAGPPTPFPPGVVTATPDRVLVTATPRPQNRTTAAAMRARATIDALTTGTATPTPRNWVTPTALPLLVPVRQLSPTPAPTGTPSAIPPSLRGKIAFLSDRLGRPQLFVMDPDGQNVAWLTQRYPYDAALAREPLAPNGLWRAIVQPDQRGSPQIYRYNPGGGATAAVTHLDGLAYDPAWSPRGQPLAFVSTHQGNDEIYTVNSDGSGLQRLTANTWEWDKHPSWSPDGAQIVFYSNRHTGRRQIWIMDADGSNPRNISNNDCEDWDPVWIK